MGDITSSSPVIEPENGLRLTSSSTRVDLRPHGIGEHDDLNVGDILALVKYGVGNETPIWHTLPITIDGSSLVATDNVVQIEFVRTVAELQGYHPTWLSVDPSFGGSVLVKSINLKWDGSLGHI